MFLLVLQVSLHSRVWFEWRQIVVLCNVRWIEYNDHNMVLVVTLQSVGEDSWPDKSVYDKLSTEDMLLLPALHVNLLG